MATKTKTAPAAPSEATLEARLTAALELFHGGKAEAAAALQAVLDEAVAAGETHVSLARVARNHLTALKDRQEGKAKEEVDPMAAATAALNLKDAKQALSLLEKAASGLQARPAFHYLYAQALVLDGQVEAGAESLGKALAGDRDLFFAYLLEPDFEAARRHPAYQAFEQA